MKEADVIASQVIVNQAMKDLTFFLHEYAKTANIDSSAQEKLLAFIQTTLSASFDKAVQKTSLHRQINTDMRQGLQHRHKTIPTVADFEEASPPENTKKLFTEAAKQIKEVMATTLEATEDIMAEVERLLDHLRKMGECLEEIKKSTGDDSGNPLIDNVATCKDSLTRIMVTLSFQDITGQRLKKVVTTLGEIQDSIFDLYVSSGLMPKTSEEMPERNMEEIALENKRQMDAIKTDKGSTLKGPTRGSNQTDVDSLLADLGL